jgi:hypothetical protein
VGEIDSQQHGGMLQQFGLTGRPGKYADEGEEPIHQQSNW